jgi:hypothetical protein
VPVGRPRAGDEHEPPGDGGRLELEDAAPDAQRGAAVGRAMEAVCGDQQGARRVEVGVGRGLRVGHAPAGPVPREQAVVALEVAMRPPPDGREAAAVAGRGGEEHRVRLPLADRVAALVVADHAPVRPDVAGEEARRRRPRRGLRGGARRAPG